MSSIVNTNDGIPVSYVNREKPVEKTKGIAEFVKAEKTRAEAQRVKIEEIWNDCWNLYRGKEDFEDKMDWQARLSAPKSFNSVKQATNAFIRMLELSKKSWELGPVNPDDEVSKIRGARLTSLIDFFLEEADFLTQFQEGLETANIGGIGVWKMWWSLEERDDISIQPIINNLGQVTGERLLRGKVEEGRLKIKAVDPYNFYWLEGSELNNFTGTIEESFIPRFQLKEIIDRINKNKSDSEKIDIDAIFASANATSLNTKNQINRFDAHTTSNSPSNKGLERIKLTEYFGPIFNEDGEVVYKAGHALIANDTVELLVQENPNWHRRPPYVGFSPLLIPHRDIGIGLVEMVREVDRQFSRLANMSIDTLYFKLIPSFEAYPEAYEDEEELDTGIIPGKIFRRDRSSMSLPPIQPIVSEDISNGSVQMMANLDRLHQEGSFVSELQSSLPRLRGSQTATEVQTKAVQENSFLSAIAREVDERAIKPLVELAMETVLQNVDTANDPRIGSILGIGQDELSGLDIISITKIIQGDYILQVHGVTEQINRIESLESLVQFMNIVGQNDAWLPNINQQELFKRILEGFPNIRDVDRLVNDPDTIEAQRLALQNSELTPEIIRNIPGLLRSIAQLKRDGVLDSLTPQLQQATAESLEAQQEAAEKQQKDATEIQELQTDATKAQLKRVISGEEAGEIDKAGPDI